MEELIRSRLRLLHTVAPDSAGDLLRLELAACDAEKGEYVFLGKTAPWMRNAAGTLHGGMCATVADQAMGTVAYCLMPGEGFAPTVEMSIHYHRPLIPGEDVRIRVRAVSVTRSLIRTAAELYRGGAPEKLCVSAEATYFYKPANEK